MWRRVVVVTHGKYISLDNNNIYSIDKRKKTVCFSSFRRMYASNFLGHGPFQIGFAVAFGDRARYSIQFSITALNTRKRSVLMPLCHCFVHYSQIEKKSRLVESVTCFPAHPRIISWLRSLFHTNRHCRYYVNIN